MIEKLQTILAIIGALASVGLPLLARKHAALARALGDVLDAVQTVSHGPTKDAVAEVSHPTVQNHEVSQ